jgi:hypothetical protein
MHTVELLEKTMALAERLGYTVRQEWLGGAGGGACEFGGRKFVFVDLSLTVVEQLEQVASAIRNDPSLPHVDAPVSVQTYLGAKRAA